MAGAVAHLLAIKRRTVILEAIGVATDAALGLAQTAVDPT